VAWVARGDRARRAGRRVVRRLPCNFLSPFRETRIQHRTATSTIVFPMPGFNFSYFEKSTFRSIASVAVVDVVDESWGPSPLFSVHGSAWAVPSFSCFKLVSNYSPNLESPSRTDGPKASTLRFFFRVVHLLLLGSLCTVLQGGEPSFHCIVPQCTARLAGGPGQHSLYFITRGSDFSTSQQVLCINRVSPNSHSSSRRVFHSVRSFLWPSVPSFFSL
jgi:hypothetical protein